MKPEDALDRYLDASEESAKRSRQAVMAALVGSVVIFAAIWNSRPGNWSHYELAVLMEQRKATALRLRFLEATSRVAPAPPDSLGAVLQEVDLNTQRANLAGLDGMISRVQGSVIESYHVKVPFFGVSFHLNDAGLIGCFALIVLSVLVTYGFKRQLLSLRVLFDEGRAQECLDRCYHIAGMFQVLTTVPTRADPYWGFARHVPKLLLLGPVTTGTFVLMVDWRTRGSIPSELFVQRMVLSSVFLYILAILTGSALLYAHRLDHLWEAAARELGILELPPPAPSKTERRVVPLRPAGEVVPAPSLEQDTVSRPAPVAAAANIPQIPVVTRTQPPTVTAAAGGDSVIPENSSPARDGDRADPTDVADG
jgi:hypothetical protein